jgi:hypothetical protein
MLSGTIKTKSRLAVTIGHQTRIAEIIFFGQPNGEGCKREALMAGTFARVGKCAASVPEFDVQCQYQLQDELHGVLGEHPSLGAVHQLYLTACSKWALRTDCDNLLTLDEWEGCGVDKRCIVACAGRPLRGPFEGEIVNGDAACMHYGLEWAVFLLNKPVTAPRGSVMVSTQLDLDLAHAEATCRIAFYGNVVHLFEAKDRHKELKLYRVRLPIAILADACSMMMALATSMMVLATL